MAFEPIHEMFRSAASRYPERIALESPRGSTRYRDLEDRSNRLARHLLDQDAPRGFLLGIYADDLEVLVTSILGAFKAGGGFVVLHPDLPRARLDSMIEMVEPAWIVAEPKRESEARDLATATDAQVLVPGKGEYGEMGEVEPVESRSEPDDLAYVYFTSGSTGKPKGIAGRLKAIDHFVRWEIETFDLGHGPRVSQLTAPSFDAFLRDVFVPLTTGGTSVRPDRDSLLDAQRLADWLDIEEIELIHCVPSLFRTLLSADLRPEYFDSLRYVLMSGEPLLPSDVERWMKVFGDRVELVNLYGPSETTMTKFFYRVQPEDREKASVSIGQPMPGARAVLLDRTGKAAPQGAVGEIYIRTPYRTLGYFRNPELTSKVFVPNPFGGDPDDLVYRTGDLARVLPDGNFEFLGRADQQVKIRGNRIELPEVESILRKHESVQDVAVVDRADATGTKYLCAYVVLEPAVPTAELQETVETFLPEYMVPSVFVPLADLPRTLTGKVDRKALPSPSEALQEDASYEAPGTDTEIRLAEIWSQLLAVERIGIHHSFFELGGHSLLATQMLSRVRNAFDVELPLRRLFDTPTLGGVAEVVDELHGEQQGSLVPPLEPTSRDVERFPLSFAQERLWFLDRLNEGNPAYHVPQAVRIRGGLSLPALRQSLEQLVRRHESLRTRLPVVDSQPVQVIEEPAPVPMPLVDLSGLDADDVERLRSKGASLEARRPFDLLRGPLFRTLVIRADHEHDLVLTMHHVTSDDWSRAVLTREWVHLYRDVSQGAPSSLPELEIQQVDFAVWQRDWMRGKVLDEELDFWRRKLDDIPVLELPTDRPRPAVVSFEGAAVQRLMAPELTDSLKELERSEGVTLFMIIMAAYQILLGRYAGQDDLVVGTPVAGRNRAEIEGLIGFFVNTLVMRSDLSGEPTFREFLKQLRQGSLEAFSHQELPFEKIVEALQPERDRSHAPLFQVVFAMQNVAHETVEVPGLEFDFPRVDTGTVKADLDMDVADSGDGLLAAMSYSTALFDATTVKRFLAHLEILLTAAAEDPDRSIFGLDFTTAAERHQMLYEWNDTARTVEPVGMYELYARQARQHPEAEAVRFGDETLTYDQLDRKTNQLARYLQMMGVGPEVRVGLCMDRSLDLLVGTLGILKAGGAFVALDPTYPMERLSFMIQEAGITILLTRETVSDSLPMHWGFTLYMDTDWGQVESHSDEPVDTRVQPDNLAYVIFTSGSTGEPKAVLVSHRGIANLAEAQKRSFGNQPGDRVLQFASLSFDASVFELIMAAGAGAALEMAPRAHLLPGPPLAALLEETAIRTVTLPPSSLAATPEADLPDLEVITVAGEACPASLVARWSPGRDFFNLYGPTETTIWASMERCVPGTAPTLGRPIDNTRIHVVDGRGCPVPIGVPGELLIGGVGLARGYLGKPGMTASRFVPDAVGEVDGGRLYRTGDLVRYSIQGTLEFLGRVDQQVKIRGFRIELQEVESVLGEHRGVAEVAAAAGGSVSDNQFLAAYVVPTDGVELTVDGLRAHAAERMPEYMVPSVFLFLDELPRLPGGKIDRRSLPSPDETVVGRARTSRPATSPVEQILAEVWAEVLGIEQVGLDDNFFDLGGHSLAATQVLSRVGDVLNVDVPLGDFFDMPTLVGLRDQVETRRRGGEESGPPLERVSREETGFPLSLAQRQLADRRTDDDRSFGSDHVPAMFELRGSLVPEALRAALSEIVRRHEALRTVFPRESGQTFQQIAEPTPMELAVVDLAPVEENLDALGRAAIERPFDLAHGPLFRARLVRRSAEEFVLVLVGHHLVLDQWSAGIFVGELSTLYRRFTAGRPSSLPELEIQYVDISEWQRRSMEEGDFEAQVSYWRRQLSDARPLGLAQEASPPPAGPSAVQAFRLSPETTRGLRSLGREHGATLFMTVLAAFKALLARVTGSRDLVVRTPVAHRSRLEAEPLIGFFPNALVLRTRLSGDEELREILDQVRDTTLEAYRNQDLPFEAVATALGDDAPSEELLQITCNFYSAPTDLPELPELTVTPVETRKMWMHGQLVLLLGETPEGLECGLHYRQDLFDAEWGVEMAGRLQSLLHLMVRVPEESLDALPQTAEDPVLLETATTT